ncbi:MAG: hypothetical protein R3B90_09975 [Planctomycetaceae bacterium]
MPPTLETALKTLDEVDTYAACREIEAAPTAVAACELYHQALKTLYFQRRDLRGMTAVGRAGIHFALSRAQVITSDDPAQAAELRSWAKTMAYDLSANLWPGWRDEGITLTEADLANGLEAARLNLRLAIELDKPLDRQADAHWLVGAHELAAHRSAAAIAAFTKSAELALAADQLDTALMSRGYVAIAQLQANPADQQARAVLDGEIAKLRERGTDDASFFADQLVSVGELYGRVAERAADR